MNYYIFFALLGFFGLITVSIIYVNKLLKKNVPKAENIVSDVNKLMPKIEKTYNNICNQGIQIKIKKGSIGKYLAIGEVPNQDSNIEVKIPCQN